MLRLLAGQSDVWALISMIRKRPVFARLVVRWARVGCVLFVVVHLADSCTSKRPEPTGAADLKDNKDGEM